MSGLSGGEDYSSTMHTLQVSIFTLDYYPRQQESDNSDCLQMSDLEMSGNVSLTFGDSGSGDCTMFMSCDIGTLRELFSLDHCLNTGPTIDNRGDDARVESLGPVIHRCCSAVIPHR